VFAALLHGLFDTVAAVISTGIVAVISLPAFVWIVYFQVVKKEIAEAEAESPHRTQSLTSPQHPTQSAFKFCPRCGTPVVLGGKFCVNCGEPVT
jgi:ribosomal protein S27AE